LHATNDQRVALSREVEGSNRERTPIVDQHATWLAVNPIQGCPKSCAYCSLQERGQTAVKPEYLAGSAETVQRLATSPYYEPDRPGALFVGACCSAEETHDD
jgi:DNA repair photolyase